MASNLKQSGRTRDANITMLGFMRTHYDIEAKKAAKCDIFDA